MTDATTVGRILREYHQRAIHPSGVRRVSGSVRGDRVSYLLMPPGREPVVVSAVRAEAPVGAQFSGCGAVTMLDWLAGRAATLAWLAEQRYPAPRVVPTRTGDLLGLAGPWLTLATTFVSGMALRPDRGQLAMLGEALGRLHSLSPAAVDLVVGTAADVAADAFADVTADGERSLGVPLGKSSWHPDAAIPATLRRLDSVEALLPAQWRPLHAVFRQTIEAVRRHSASLPQSVVHGDARPGNAVLVAAGEAGAGEAGVTLTDWEASGLGLPLLDLGRCLLECHLDTDRPPDQPEAWLIHPDDERIAAVAEGYSTRRVPEPGELDLLPDAVRFGAAFIGAIHFEQALIGGARGAAMDARLERLGNRLAVSPAVAERALHHLARTGKRYAGHGRPEAAGA